MKCPVCGKRFDVLWPNQWAYKSDKKFLCSYGCVRRMERGEKDMEKFTKEQRQEAIRIALDGGDVKGYLKSIGSTAPDKLWYYMKTQLRKKDPETWEKLKKMDGKKVTAKPVPAKKIVETPEGEYAPATVNVDGPLRIQTPETKNVQVVEVPEKVAHILPDASVEAQIPGKKIEKPGKRGFFMPAYIQGFEIVGVKGQYGVYRASEEYNYFEFQPFGGDMCMNPQDWAEQMKELKKAARVLGVEL